MFKNDKGKAQKEKNDRLEEVEKTHKTS